MRKDFCITSENTSDNFVGIRFVNGEPEVVFPRGYNIPKGEKERRKDIFRLIYVLQRFSRDQNEGDKVKGTTEASSIMPIQSYQYIIQDYLSNGYYVEKETEYISAQRGKINWKKTIQKEQTWINNGNPVYLQYQISRNKINDSNLITLVHKYCVYLSFKMFGWLYLEQNFLPEKPPIKFNKEYFVSVVEQALKSTNNDNKKKLFTSMLNVLNDNKEDFNYRTNSLGVNHFAGVWERLINYVFGEDNIEKYFPHAKWHILRDGKFVESSALEPDTIMKYDGKIYILDAKYYQYGVTERPDDLPNTSSIQKQITYAKHVEALNEVDKDKIYNAFVLPYNGADGEYILKFVAVGTGGWEQPEENRNYQYVLGMLLDTRHLMTTFVKHNKKEIEELANKIEESIEMYKQKLAELNG